MERKMQSMDWDDDTEYVTVPETPEEKVVRHICYALNQAFGCTGADKQHAELECFVGELGKLLPREQRHYLEIQWECINRIEEVK